MNINGAFLDSVKNEVVFNNKVAVSNLGELVFFWDAPKMGAGRKQREALFDFCCKRFGARKPLGGNVSDNLGEVVLGNTQQADTVSKPTHEASFGGLS